MSFLLSPIVDATTNGFSPFGLGGMGGFGFPMMVPPPQVFGGQGVFHPFNEAPLFPSAAPGVGRGFYGSGLFGGAFSPWSPQSPLDLWGDDFYQHDQFAAGATLLGWGDTMLMTDPFLMHYRNWSSWPPISFWPFNDPSKQQNGQGQPTSGTESAQTAKNTPPSPAGGDAETQEARKDLESRAQAEQKKLEAREQEIQEQAKKAEDKMRADAEKRDTDFDEKVKKSQDEQEEDRLKAKNEAEADHQRRKREIDKATGKPPPPKAKGGRAGG
ncbi:MAG: hypothetical protein Q8P84_06295 [Deltaproteobacteria bacterium]|nr:hypothetical protein [Deltaproteobacteria bacterium]